jgi:hypothetical protein
MTQKAALVTGLRETSGRVHQPAEDHYRTGFGARPLLLMRKVQSDRAFDALIKRASGVPGLPPTRLEQQEATP